MPCAIHMQDVYDVHMICIYIYTNHMQLYPICIWFVYTYIQIICNMYMMCIRYVFYSHIIRIWSTYDLHTIYIDHCYDLHVLPTRLTPTCLAGPPHARGDSRHPAKAAPPPMLLQSSTRFSIDLYTFLTQVHTKLYVNHMQITYNSNRIHIRFTHAGRNFGNLINFWKFK